jgi:hypothetical protein
MVRARSAVLLVAVALTAAGCANDEPGAGATGSQTGTTGPTGATATGSIPPSDSPTASESPSAEPAELEDGRHFGYVRSVDVEALSLVFDLAYFLTGDEANAAAAEHGLETPVPNDYYIQNDNPKLRTLDFAPDIELVLLDWNHCCDETFQGNLGDFADAINGGEPVTVGDVVYQGALSQYWVTVEGGLLTRIEEQYLP